MRSLLVLFVGIVTSCASTHQSQHPSASLDAIARLRQEIDFILEDSSLYQSRVGIKVVSLESDEVLYSKDSQLLFHPASNMKLLTTATALSRLGTDFKFKTTAYADTSSLRDSTLHGNLYLKGFGNPDLETVDLNWMVKRLKAEGVKKITGDLICDDSYFDDLYWGAGWMWDDVSAWYYASIGALTVNDNCVTVTVKPAQSIGDPLLIRLEPNTTYMKIENFGVTVDSLDSTRIRQFKVQRKWRPPENTVVIEGGRSVGAEERNYVIDVVDPALYCGTLFAELLRRSGIELAGVVLRGAVPDTNIVLVEHLSSPLTTVIINTNKVSDNLSAEILLKTLGAELKNVPGTAEQGLFVVKEFFHEIGVDTTTFDLADGSGVSRYNLVSPDHIIELLKAMHTDFRVQAEFKTSLPIAAVDGTLENRMHGTEAAGKLRAKTGSLRGVSSLSGYTTTAGGEPLAFSMIMEHFVLPTSRIRKIQDRIGAVISRLQRPAPDRITSTSKP